MTMHRELYCTNPNEVAGIRAVFDREFAGRFFAVGNPYTNAVWGKVGTFNSASDELERDEACGNGGSGCNILEVTADGVPIKKPLAA